MKIIKKTSDGRKTVVAKTYHGHAYGIDIDLKFDKWIDVKREPFVKATAVYDGGATCMVKVAWNDEWIRGWR